LITIKSDNIKQRGTCMNNIALILNTKFEQQYAMHTNTNVIIIECPSTHLLSHYANVREIAPNRAYSTMQ